MADPFGGAMDFIMNNIWIFVIIGGVIFFIYYFTSFRNKTKIIKRSDIERQEFIRRLRFNKSKDYKWLFQGDEVKGYIEKFRPLHLADGKAVEKQATAVKPQIKVTFLEDFDKFKKGDTFSFDKGLKEDEDFALALTVKNIVKTEVVEPPSEHIFLQMLVRPVFFGKLKIANPFSHIEPFQISLNDGVKLDLATKSVTVPDGRGFDLFEGINYDMSTMEHLNLINENMLRTDFNSIASIYFVKSQEQSTYNPEFAHDMAMKQRELDIELAKRKGKMTTI